MSFLTPLAALGALIAIPIILLYMLRLRRREMVISSNFLWQQIVRDQEANTPWQRLKRNILLILQLIILALIILALMRPAQLVPTITAGKTVILLDASASMAATDVDDESRFSAAQEQANLLVNDLTGDDEISVIRVADVAEPLITYTSDFRAVRDAIFAAEVGQGRGDWDTALTLAAAGAEGTDNFSIIVISDGGIVDSGQLPENIPAPIYLPIGETQSNVAITALATRTLPGENPQLFAQVQNYNTEASEIALLIRLDGEIWESTTQTVSAESSRSFVFDVDEDFTTIQAELVLDEAIPDFLQADNDAFTVASDNAIRRVLLLSNQRNVFLEEVLRSLPSVQIFRGDTTSPNLPSTPYDLYIFNNYLPETLPDADMLIINPPTSSEIFTLGSSNEDTRNLSIVERGHPLATFVNLDSVNLRAFQNLSDVEWASSIAATEGGTIIYAGENRGRQIAILNFDLLDSDLPLQIAFPIFMSNTIEWASPANIISGGTAFSVGDVIRINPPLEATAVRVVLPDQQVRDLALNDDSLIFSETQQLGFYRVEILLGDTVLNADVFAVNLFGSGESNIAPVPDTELDLGGGELDEDAEEQFGFREWWRPLTLIALAILLYEWYLYYQRLRVPENIDVEVRRTTARN